MKKTLYARIVFVFICITIISLMVSTFVGLNLFQQKINQDGQNSMIEKSEEIINLYQQIDKPKTETFFKQIAKATSYPIHLYNQKKEAQFFTLDNNNKADISDKSITEVLSGKTYRSTRKQKDTYVGVPINIDGQDYAMFLQFSYENEMIFNYLLLFVIVGTLIIGSLLILIVARYLILPLKKLKEATDMIAAGDFDVDLDLKRQDEVGELARSFNKMTDELKQIEDMRQNFVSNVSHEIQSPLTSISGFAKALKNEQLISDEQRPYYLNIIISESERLSRLGDNLLKLASLDSEHHPFSLESFDVVEQIREVIVTLETQWSQKKITISLISEEGYAVEGDYDLLQQVWLNLISNAIKFTPELGEINVIITCEKQLIITFRDSGIGISEKDINYIFQRFYKSDKSRNTEQVGNGLGLAIVKKIIDLHHGTISVKNNHQGTDFVVTLPLSQ